jgi:hypothetical protein
MLATAAASLSSAVATPATAATMFKIDAANTFLQVTSNDKACVGSCSITTEQAAAFPTFFLDVGQSFTFDFASVAVNSGFGAGIASLTAQLAFLQPSALVADSSSTARYVRLGGFFTPGLLGGALVWSDPSQQLTAADGSRFTVSFADIKGLEFGRSVRTPVTVTLDSVASAVPEPATWAMMLIGLGTIGASVRRRKARVSVAYA